MSSQTMPPDFYAGRLANKENIKQWHDQEKAKRTVKALGKHGFNAIFLQDRNQARDEILNHIPQGATIGIGGTMTIREIGVLEELSQRGHIIYDHWKPGLSQDEILNIRRAHLTCDVFLTSVNAMTENGVMVSTDGIGNRTSAMTFGPKKVIIAIGVNKIVADLEVAFRRIKEIAAPLTIGDTNAPLPCVQTGICNDCDSPRRVCRVTLIMERRPSLTEIDVLVIGESLGF